MDRRCSFGSLRKAAARTAAARTAAAGKAAAAVGVAALLLAPAWARAAEEPKYAADVPANITTPDSIDTRIGTLRFHYGTPDEDTVKLVYEQLDFYRGIGAFMAGMSATSVYALCDGIEDAGASFNGGIAITEDLMDARTLFLTPNTTTVYVIMCADLKEGPVVLDVPPAVLGTVDDGYFRWVTDVGLTGRDAGKGGKYLLVPPGHKGSLPSEGYLVSNSKTNRLLIFYRAFVEKGDIAAAVDRVKSSANIYPLSAADNPPAAKIVDISGKKFNTISSNSFHFYEELNAVVQNEPVDFVDPNLVGLFGAIGIRKGKPFAPDDRMKSLLTDAVAVGNAIARANLIDSRDPETQIYTDRQWLTPFVGGSYQFIVDSRRLLDARAMFFYYATGITPAMSKSKPGSGSAYGVTFKDSKGDTFDGGKTYKLDLPGPIPAKNFWAITVYDNQTRSLLETDQRSAGIDSTLPDVKPNADGSVTVWLGPEAPAGKEGNWIQTMPGKGWNAVLRLYGPLEPWFDKSWKPSDIEPVK